MSVAPLTSAEISDTRRFCGYPVVGSLSSQSPIIQGDSGILNATIAVLTDDQIMTLRTVFLANLYTIESGIPAASVTLDVDKAAVYTRNANELADRETLFESWRLKLCYFLGVAPGAGIYASSGSLGPIPVAFAV